MRPKKWNLTLILVLMLGAGVGYGFGPVAPNIVSLKIGKDKAMTRQTSSFGPQDTIYATSQIANVADQVNVKARLFVEDIPGIAPGPIKGLEVTVKITRSGQTDFNFSAPTKGWPNGKYSIEVDVLDGHGDEADHKSAEFSVQ